MDSDQWKQLDKLLHAALQRPAGERDAYLAEAMTAMKLICSALARSYRITGSQENSAVAEWAWFTRPRTLN
jgi:hypothetical protein